MHKLGPGFACLARNALPTPYVECDVDRTVLVSAHIGLDAHCVSLSRSAASTQASLKSLCVDLFIDITSSSAAIK